MGAGELTIASGTSKLAEGTFTYNVPEWKPVVDYRAGGVEDFATGRCAAALGTPSITGI